MAIIIKPPENTPIVNKLLSVFLAGTIDNGNSEDWQHIVENKLSLLNILIFNPRRDDWGNKLEILEDSPVFKEQVTWELNNLDSVDFIFMYFASSSLSPITLLELGLYINKPNLILVCPDEFWRSGNVKITAKRNNVIVYDSLEEGLSVLISKLECS